MATGKRYYWMKLKESFLSSDAVDFLMGQPNGAQYVVLYQMLCLKTINTDGRLSRQIGEIIIPYDVAKIKRDCKYFTEDTINIALQLYIRLGLVYQDIDGVLVMADHYNLIGSSTDYADQKRTQRLANNANSLPAPSPEPVDNSVDNVHQSVHTDIRDKEIDIRDKEVNKGTNKAETFSDFAAGNDDLLSALKDFEKMRTKIKKPMTDRAKALLINKLQTFPREQWIAILEQSIMHDWQNIYALKEASASKSESKREYKKTEDSL